MKKNRMKYLDCARGFAMILVMYAHFFTVKESPLRLWIYSFHMPIFFIITGILIYKKNTQLDIKRQVKKLLIPYFIFSFITASGIALLDILKNKNWLTPFVTNIKKIVLFYGVKADWFLPCLFLALILFHFIKDNIKNDQKIILSMILIFLIPFINIDVTNIYTYTIICRSLIATVFIFSGYFLGKYFEKVNVKLYMIIILFLASLVLSKILGFVDLYSLKFSDPYIYYISGIVGSFCFLSLFKYLEKKNIQFKLLEFIGQNSIIFLGTHMVFGYFVKYVFSQILNTNYIVPNLYLNGVIILILVLLIEFIIIKIFYFILRKKQGVLE